MQWIDSISDTELLDYLPQLVQVCAGMGVLHGMCSEMQCDTHTGMGVLQDDQDWDAAVDVRWVDGVNGIHARIGVQHWACAWTRTQLGACAVPPAPQNYPLFP